MPNEIEELKQAYDNFLGKLPSLIENEDIRLFDLTICNLISKTKELMRSKELD